LIITLSHIRNFDFCVSNNRVALKVLFQKNLLFTRWQKKYLKFQRL